MQAWWWRRPPVVIPLFGRVPGRASEPSGTRVDNDGGYRTFRGWRLGCLGFFPRMWIYRRKGEVGGCPRGPHHGAVHPGGGPRHHQVWPPRFPALSPLRTPWTCQKNRNFGFCFIQFREYFLE
jgi:hypothetical protein